MKTFLHSGDIGDIIYSLPAVKKLGGGIYYISLNKTKRGFGLPTKFNKYCYDIVRPLLLEQDYIEDVRLWNGEAIDYDMDIFREQPDVATTNLAKLHCTAFGIDPVIIDDQWLDVEPGVMPEGKRIIFARTPRYHGNFNWTAHVKAYGHEAIFVGLKEEYDMFVKTFNCSDIPYVPTKDLLELARLIKACDFFVGNQSCHFAIAQGLHKRNRLEISRSSPNNIFKEIK